MNNLEKVVFTCPQCGVQWTEWQDLNHEWFKLATNQTLCTNCVQVIMERILSNIDKNEE